jgi:hypothetical protein
VERRVEREPWGDEQTTSEVRWASSESTPGRTDGPRRRNLLNDLDEFVPAVPTPHGLVLREKIEQTLAFAGGLAALFVAALLT